MRMNIFSLNREVQSRQEYDIKLLNLTPGFVTLDSTVVNKELMLGLTLFLTQR